MIYQKAYISTLGEDYEEMQLLGGLNIRRRCAADGVRTGVIIAGKYTHVILCLQSVWYVNFNFCFTPQKKYYTWMILQINNSDIPKQADKICSVTSLQIKRVSKVPHQLY